MIGRTSGASRFNIDKFSEILGLWGMERIVSKGDNFVVDALFYFKPVLRLAVFKWKRKVIALITYFLNQIIDLEVSQILTDKYVDDIKKCIQFPIAGSCYNMTRISRDVN